MCAIEKRKSEPEFQNQNPAEQSIQKVKKIIDALMDWAGTPEKYWLVGILYVVMLLNY